MKLIALPTSPYAARVRIQVYEKGISVPEAHPLEVAGADRPDVLNPFAKTPVLMVGDECIVESAAIQEYLEDIYPEPSLRGSDALTTAKMRAFVRAVDLYLFPIIYALRGLEEGADDLAAVLNSLYQTIERLEKLFCGRVYVCGDRLTLADCALVPACYFVERFLARHGRESVFAVRPVLRDWWSAVSTHQSVNRTLAELETAICRAINQAG